MDTQQATPVTRPLTDNKTVIIPGHGPVSDKNSLVAYTDMLKTVSGRMRKMIAEQLTLEQILAAGPTKDFDRKNAAFVKCSTQI